MLGAPWRARSVACSSARELVPLRLPLVDRERAVGLGQPVQVGHGEVHRRHPGQQRRRRRRAAGVHVHLVVQGSGRGIFGDHGQHGRRGAEVGDPLLPQQPPDLGGVHGAQADVRAAGRGHGPGEAPAVAVEHRQRPQVPGARAQPGVVGHRGGLQVRAPVVVHHALGPSGRPAGVVDRQQLALVDRLRARLGGSGDPVLVGVLGAAGEEARQAGLLGQVPGPVAELAGRDQDRGSPSEPAGRPSRRPTAGCSA